MSHIFTYDPIKLKILDIKTGVVQRTYVFVGQVPAAVEKELRRAERDPKRKSPELKKFYGAYYHEKLGLGAGVTGGDEAPDHEPEPDTQVDLITDEDLLETAEQADVEPDTALLTAPETTKVKTAGSVSFVTDIELFPDDNILDFKNKIYLTTDIPIYRQHLYFVNRNRTTPANYTVRRNNNVVPVDITSLIDFYKNDTSKNDRRDSIEGIPVDLTLYANKSFTTVTAEDTFSLLVTNDTHVYYLVDLASLIPTDLYTRIHKDRYQLDVVYYGFIQLYFPMLTPAVFNDYLKNEKAISELYPTLKRSKRELQSVVNLETDIAAESYAAFDNPNADVFSSITSTTLSVSKNWREKEHVLILRNIFDLLELNEQVTYAKCCIPLQENQYVVCKKSYQFDKEPRDNPQIDTLMYKIRTNQDTNEHVRLILYKNGNYLIRTEWREERHMDFKAITALVSSVVNPVIKKINQLGSTVKHTDIQLPEITKDSVIFTETDIVFYYDEDMTETRFAVIKQILEDYRKAEIITQRESLTVGLDFYFNKGMHKYDSKRLEKTIGVNNYYEYLSNGAVKQKWDTVFERTRVFNVSNAASKLRMAISGIRNDLEMQIFYTYLLGLLSIYENNAPKRNIDEAMQQKAKKTLKNLKIQDPILYDFKKIYKSNVVYSKICQKPYQPLILTESEYRDLSKAKQETAVKYWNFTKEKPAWYSCPNAKYPFIKFITKVHPRDYCIPCCKKIQMSENVNIKRQEIHSECLKSFKYTGEKVSLTKGSHYIATYGKDIETGRISRLPEHTLEPLFFDTHSTSAADQECATADGYYLFGVDQHLPAVRGIGLLFCLVHALGSTVAGFLTECAMRVKKDQTRFKIILDGEITRYFSSADALAQAISNLGGNLVSNAELDIDWNQLFKSLAYNYYGINVIQFVDRERGTIDLQMPRGLRTPQELFPDGFKNLVVVTRKGLFYPVYLLNTELFKRTGVIDSRLYLNESGLMIIIRAVVVKHFENTTAGGIKKSIDLSVVKRFVKQSGLKLTAYFVNSSNLCYAVLAGLSGGSSGSNEKKTSKSESRVNKGVSKGVYFPIDASYYSLDRSVELIFKPYSDQYACSKDDLLALVDKYNQWVGKQSAAAGFGKTAMFPLIETNKNLVVDGRAIGFTSGGLNYYHQASQAAQASTKLMYDPVFINKIISTGQVGLQSSVKQDTDQAMYHHYAHSLILLHFIDVFNKQRNHGLRRSFLTTVMKTNFDKNTDRLGAFIEKVPRVEDQVKLKAIVNDYAISRNKKQLVQDLASAYFLFDRIEIEKIKKMTKKEAAAKLHQIARDFVMVGNVKVKSFPTTLVICGSSGYCASGRLQVTKQQLSDSIDVIAQHITDEMKSKWIFNSVFINRGLSMLKFIRRKHELVTVELLDI